MKKYIFLFVFLLSGKFLLLAQSPTSPDSIHQKVFARIVPERDDDFAWENDRVAFRAYGPRLQQKAEARQPGGLITSGIDCWFKRVDYPIINRWYSHMNYHRDTGEGLDCYNVGPSRGCGGTALLYHGKYYVSKNFVDYKVLSLTSTQAKFQLFYAPIFIDGHAVKETKTITIEAGHNFYRCDVHYSSDLPLSIVSAGIALHRNQGHLSRPCQGSISYWEKIQDAEVGTAVWCAPINYAGYEIQHTSNAYLHVALHNNTATFYSGFTWTKAGHHKTEREWLEYIKDWSRK